MTTGGGGVLIAHDLSYARLLASQGKDDSGEFVEVGVNYRMAGLAASLGLSQLKRYPELLKRKREIHDLYVSKLSDVCLFQKAQKDSEPSWWYTAALFPVEAETLQKRLSAKGISSRRVFKPITQYKPYRSQQKFPIAEQLYRYGLCLPSSTLNTDDDIKEVCKAIRDSI
jgi:perosamine synthetase